MQQAQAAWFHEQRAGGTGRRIPAGALARAALAARASSVTPGNGSPVEGPWVQIGPAPVGADGPTGLTAPVTGRIQAIISANAQTWYAVSADGGVWKTNDGGASWQPPADPQASIAGTALAVDPTDANTLWWGTGEAGCAVDSYYGAGIMKSADGGATWTQFGAGLFQGAAIAKIAVDPTSSPGNRTLWASTSACIDANRSAGLPLGTGLAKSIDGGLTWAFIPDAQIGGSNSVGGQVYPVQSSDVAVSASGIVYATRYNATDDPSTAVDERTALQGIYRQRPGETGFTKLVNGLPTPWQNVGRIALAVTCDHPTTNCPETNTVLYTAMEYSPTHSLLGVWRSTDGGTNWSLLGASSSNDQWFRSTSIAVDPTNYNTAYLGGPDLFRTVDGGTTWSDLTVATNLPMLDVHGFGFWASNPVTVVVATSEGAFKSLDGGATWSGANGTTAALAITTTLSGAVDPSNASALYVGSDDVGLVRYSGTTTWSQLSASGTGKVGFAKAVPGRVSPVQASNPTGDSASINASGYSGGTATAYTVTVGNVDTLGRIVAIRVTAYEGGTTTSVQRSIISPSSSPPATVPIQHGVVLSITANGGSGVGDVFTFTVMASTDTLYQVGSVANSETLPDASKVPVLRQDSGGWQNVSVVRCTPIASPNTTDCFNPTIDREGFQPPFAIDPRDPNTVYVGTNRVFVSRDRGVTWRLLYVGPVPSVPNDIASVPNPGSGGCNGPCVLSSGYLTAIGIGRDSVVPSIGTGLRAGTIYAGDNTGRIWVTTPTVSVTSPLCAVNSNGTRVTDGVAQCWIAEGAANGLPVGRYLTAIAVDPVAAGVAYATYSGFNAATPGKNGHVFKTTNNGLNWTDISGSLPDVPTNTIVIDGSNSSYLYVGTDIGVWKSMDGGQTWLQLTSGLPRTTVMDLQLFTPLGATAPTMLYAMTYGRSVYATTRAIDQAPTISAISAATNPFRPNGSSTTTINFTLADYRTDTPPTTTLTVLAQVYNEQGGLVTTLLNQVPETVPQQGPDPRHFQGTFSTTWNGEDSQSNLVLDGTYQIRFTAVDNVSNQALQQSGSVVIDRFSPCFSTVLVPAGGSCPSPPTVNASPNPFSPNGDGIKDSTVFSYTTSEWGSITLQIFAGNCGTGTLRRTLVSNARRAPSASNSDVWDGKDDAGATVVAPGAQGTFSYCITFTDDAYPLNGNNPANRATASGTVVVNLQPPAAGPSISDPVSQAFTNQATYTIKGGAADAGALIRVYADTNHNGVHDSNEPLVTQQQLAAGATTFAVAVPLVSNADNFFVVSSTNAAGNESPVTAAATITSDIVSPVFTNVNSTPTRFSPNGDGASDVTSLRYTLSESGSVTLVILDSGNRTVRTLVSQRNRPAGQSQDRWDGTSDVTAGPYVSGAVVPDGFYTFKVDATDRAGNSTAASTPISTATGTVTVANSGPTIGLASTSPVAFSPPRTAQLGYTLSSPGTVTVRIHATPLLTQGAITRSNAAGDPGSYSGAFNAPASVAFVVRVAGVDSITPVVRSYLPSDTGTVSGVYTGAGSTGYVVRVSAVTGGHATQVQVSTDGGATFPTTIAVTGVSPIALGNGLSFAFGTDGTSLNGNTYVFTATSGRHATRVQVSTDGGATFGLALDSIPVGAPNAGSFAIGNGIAFTFDTSGATSVSPGDTYSFSMTVGALQRTLLLAQSVTQLAPSVVSSTWDGRTDAGTQVPDGLYAFTVNATDVSGAQGAEQAGSVIVDTLAPGPPTVSSPVPVPPATNVTLADVNTVTISGTAEANALVRAWPASGGAALPGAPAAASQQLTAGATGFSLTVGLVQNTTNNFVVTATDAAGNESAVAVVSPIVESTAPMVISAVSEAPSPFAPPSPATISYTLSKRSSVTIRINSVSSPSPTLVRTMLVPDSGVGPYPLAQTAAWDGLNMSGVQAPDGLYGFTIDAVDALNNPSIQKSGTVVVDTGPPSTMSSSVNQNPFSPNGDGIKDATTIYYTISEPGTVTVKVFDGSGTLVRTLVNAAQFVGANLVVWDGRNTANNVVADGSYTYRINVVDTAGRSAPEISGTIVVDTLAPVPPINVLPAAGSAVIVNSGPSGTTLISGTAEANSFVQVWVDANNNGLLDSGETDRRGSAQLTSGNTAFSIAASLNRNSIIHLVVTATDAAGNQSVAAVVGPITEDSTLPSFGTVNAAPSAFSPVRGGTTTISFALSKAANVTLQIVNSASAIVRTFTLGTLGPVTRTSPISDSGIVSGVYTGAGQASYVISVVDVAARHPAHVVVSTDGGRTFGPSLPVSGTAALSIGNGLSFQFGAAGSTSAGDAYTFTATTDSGSSAFTWDGKDGAGTVQPDGPYTFKLTAVDAANNTAVVFGTVAVASVAPVISSVGVSNAAFSPNGDGVKDTTDILYTLSAAANVRIGILSGATPVRTLVNNLPRGSGVQRETWDGLSSLGVVVASGTYTFTIDATDAAGNAATTQTGSVIVNTAPPAAPVVTAPSGSFSTTASSVVTMGTAPAGSLVQVWVDSNGNGVKDAAENTIAGSQQLDSATSNFSITAILAPNSTNYFVVTALDGAGNRSSSTAVPSISQIPANSTATSTPTVTPTPLATPTATAVVPAPTTTPVPAPTSAPGGGGGGGGGAPASSAAAIGTSPPASVVPSVGAPANTVTPTPTATPPAGGTAPTAVSTLESGAVASGPTTRTLIPPAGGVAISSDGQLVVAASTGTGLSVDLEVDITAVLPSSLPQPPQDFVFAGTAFQILAKRSDTGQAVHEFPRPLVLTFQATSGDLAKASGDVSRLALAFWNGTTWVAVPCTIGGTTFTCTVAHLTLFALLVKPPVTAPAEIDLPNGQFYTATNGFSGASADWTGFRVVDDATAAFFTEFQRYGGVDKAGLPTSSRFMHNGFLTQAFQKLILQWRPELGMALPINTFDDLQERGTDSWLDAYRQIPGAADTAPDVGLTWEAVVARHEALLDAFQPLRDFYLADDNRLADYGLPLAVKDYGPFVAVRLQRAAFQLWKVDVPWAAAGTVVVVNGGDLAKESGLIDPAAIVPSPW